MTIATETKKRSSQLRAVEDLQLIPSVGKAVIRETGLPGEFLSLCENLLTLVRPNLTFLVILTATCGTVLAGGTLYSLQTILSIVAITGIVSASSCLNMYIERESDRSMTRTRSRPLPSGRLDPRVALLAGVLLLILSLPLLYHTANFLTVFLSGLATALYLGVYTLLKPRSHLTLFVGAISGGLPILMGYTAVNDAIDPMGITLFAVLYAWQLPHFLSIALRYESDYRQAGMRVYSVVKGAETSRRHMVYFSLLLWLVTMAPFIMNRAGELYLSVALVSGLVMFLASLACLREAATRNLDRIYFFGTLGYLPLILVTLIVDMVSEPL